MAHAIDILSFTWWAWVAPTFGIVLMLLFVSFRATEKQKLYIRWFVAGILLLSAVFIHPYLYFSGKWSVQTSLPLHMCTIAQWLAIFALLKPRQWQFDILIYWGIAGGMNAILTPQPLHGGEFPVFLEYFVEHGGIIFVPLFLAIAYQMRPSHQSWIRVFLYTVLVMAIMGVFNYYTGSNYFFTAQKPIADSPFILGDWPYYIVGFLMIGLIQFYAIYFFMNKLRSVKALKENHVIVFAKNDQ